MKGWKRLDFGVFLPLQDKRAGMYEDTSGLIFLYILSYSLRYEKRMDHVIMLRKKVQEDGRYPAGQHNGCSSMSL